MELTPELLLEAKFGPARRGYDMAEVDDFLERCAEGLDVLLARLKSEFDRAEQAEARIAELEAGGASTVDATRIEPAPEAEPEPADDAVEAEPESPSMDEPMRILLAAERTAEHAVTEAKQEAARIRSEAESVANQQRSEAERLLTTAKVEAEEEARRAGEETKRQVEAEVLALRSDRDGLSDDIGSLRRWLDEQRTRMRSTARELQRLVEDPSALQELEVPTLSEPSAPIGDGAGDVASAGTDAGEPTQAVPIVEAADGEGGEAADPWAVDTDS